MQALGVHQSVSVKFSRSAPSGNVPAVVAVLIGPQAQHNATLTRQINAATRAGLVVIPVVDSLANFTTQVPVGLSSFNGFEWSGAAPEVRLTRLLLEELGIEEQSRKVFISHRRSDGLGAAEQLHDELARFGFVPFIDRFAIRAGVDVQGRIADALEEHAFVLVLETPQAHQSPWVFDEVDYALAHAMGLLIVRWPNVSASLPGSAGIPRLALSARDLRRSGHGYKVLTRTALDQVVREVELAHAVGLVRRRRMLVRSVQEVATAAGATCIPILDSSLEITSPSGPSIVMVTPRLPESEDLQRLDELRNGVSPSAAAHLIHAARQIEASRQRHLDWLLAQRRIDVRANTDIGGLW